MADLIYTACFLLLTSCITQPLNTNTIYRKDMHIQVDRTWGNAAADIMGTAILEKQIGYNLTFYFYKKPAKFTITSCHREIVMNNPGNGAKYGYYPIPGIEDSDFCPLEFGAFDESGQHSWGIIDFKSGFEKLDAILSCNGEAVVPFSGVSICQSKAKLLQKISFTEPVKNGVSQGCPAVQTKDDKDFMIPMGRGKCLYVFKRGDDFHRLITFGYDDVILR